MPTLKRLFDYAKAQAGEPIENFTTLALVGFVRADPRPIVEQERE